MSRQERIEKVSSIKHLILSDSHDFTTDYVTIELEERGLEYLRLDRDLLSKYQVTWDLDSETLLVKKFNREYLIENHTLKSVYYRAPTYLRETFVRRKSIEEQVKQSQWMSFYRNLSCFDKAKWMNSPAKTFQAENKIFQLKVARNIGFNIPKTIIANNASHIADLNESIIVKSIDTAIFDLGDQEGFVYTTPLGRNELVEEDLSLAPVIIQNNLTPKVDFRITVVGNDTYVVKILKNGKGVDGDWRVVKSNVKYEPAEIPATIAEMCKSLMSALGLSFGAIDLIFSENQYYFVEINPTGEWAWLVDAAGINIYKSICDFLIN